MAYSSSSSSSSSHYPIVKAPVDEWIADDAFATEFLGPYNDAAVTRCRYLLANKSGFPPCDRLCRTAEECASERCEKHLGRCSMERYASMERQAKRLLAEALDEKSRARWDAKLRNIGAQIIDAKEKKREHEQKMPAPIARGTKRRCDDDGDVAPSRKRPAASSADDAKLLQYSGGKAAALPYDTTGACYDDDDDCDDDDYIDDDDLPIDVVSRRVRAESRAEDVD